MVLLSLLAPGCLTRLAVRKVAPDDTTTPGVRYSLPRPFLRATPRSDGAVEVDVVILPDSERTYAIDASSVLASHALEVAVERGLLRRVDWSADSTGAAANALRSAGSATESVLAREAEERARAEDDARDRQEARAAALARADAEVERARQDLEEARAALATLISWGGWSDEVRQARVRVAVAQAALDAAEERRRRIAGGTLAATRGVREAPGTAQQPNASVGAGKGAIAKALAPARVRSEDRLARGRPEAGAHPEAGRRPGTGPHGHDAADGDAADGDAADGDAALRARGPIVYAIDETIEEGRPCLCLVAVEGPTGDPQPSYDTATIAPPPAPEPPPVLRPSGGVYPILPSRTRILAAADALEDAEARLEELRAGGATPLTIANAMADLAEAKIDLARAHRLELTIEVSRPISRLIFDGGRTWLVRNDDDGGADARRIVSEDDARTDRAGARGSALLGSAAAKATSQDRRQAFVPPTAHDLRDWLLLASPTEIRLTLPDDIPDGDYTLRIGFEHDAGASAQAKGGGRGPGRADGTIGFTIDEE